MKHIFKSTQRREEAGLLTGYWNTSSGLGFFQGQGNVQLTSFTTSTTHDVQKNLLAPICSGLD